MSCKTGVPVVIATNRNTSGTTNGLQPVRLELASREGDEEEGQHVIKLTPMSVAEAQAEQRLTLQVDVHGRVVHIAEAPATLFSFKPQQLEGLCMSSFVDVFRAEHGADMAAVLRALVQRWEQRWLWVASVSGIPSCGSHPAPP